MSYADKLEVLELILNIVHDHERKLDRLVEELESSN